MKVGGSNLGHADLFTSTRGCCVPPKKRGEEARGHSTVRGAPQNGDGRVEADFAIMLSRITKFVFFSNVAPKILEKAENAHTHTHTHTHTQKKKKINKK